MSIAESPEARGRLSPPAVDLVDLGAEVDLPGWPTGKRWGLAKHVATVLDCDVDTVYRMRAAGRLPAIPHGERSWRFDREAILAFVRGTPTPHGAPAAAQAAQAAQVAEGGPPLARALALLGALTPDEQEVLGLEAARRAQEGRQSTARTSGLAVVRGGRR